METRVLFRKDHATEEEFDICKDIIGTVQSRLDFGYGNLIVPRYSLLPFHRELDIDAKRQDCELINTPEMHEFVADIRQWYPVVKQYTPETYENWGNLPEGQYIVKGATNSRKHEWNRRMFCNTKSDIPKVAERLLDDYLISDQGLVIRKYIKLKKFITGLNGLPITNEYRFFYYKRDIIAFDYYWSNYPEWRNVGSPVGAVLLAQQLSTLVKEYINFYVMDIAETESGDFILIELNDGCMSGLGCIDPKLFYSNLKNTLKGIQNGQSSYTQYR